MQEDLQKMDREHQDFLRNFEHLRAERRGKGG
jgi:hypothetical protein